MTLEEIKDQIANEQYGVESWYNLIAKQKAVIVDLIAIAYRKEGIEQFARDAAERAKVAK